MKTNFKRAISILLSVIMVLSVFTVVPFAVGAEETTVTAKALYQTHKIEWESDTQADFTIEKDGAAVSDAVITNVTVDSKYYYTALVPVETGRAAGDSYTVKQGETVIGTAAVEDVTGLDALKKNALVAVNYGKEGKSFTGGTGEAVQLTNVQLAKMKALANGSIIFRAQFDNTTGTQYVMKFADDTYLGGNNAAVRWQMASNWGANRQSITAGNKMTYIYSSNEAHSADYCNNNIGRYTNGGNKLLNLNGANINGLTIGENLTGTVYYALVSEESYVSKTNPAEITAAMSAVGAMEEGTPGGEVDPDPDPDPDPADPTEVTAKALYKSHKIEWVSDNQASFTIVKDNANVNATITNVVVDGKYYYTALVSVGTGTAAGTSYTVKNGNTEVGSATVADETGFDALKKNALVAKDYGEDGKAFDGTAGENLNVSAATLAKLKTLSSGSIVYYAKADDSCATNAAVLALTDNADESTPFFIGRRRGNVGFNFNSQWKATFTQYGSDTSRHTLAVSVENGVGVRTGGNGANSFTTWDTNTGASLVNSTSGTITGAYIGANGSNGIPYTGRIYYALISEEIYTNEELRILAPEYLNPNAVPTPDTGSEVKAKSAAAIQDVRNTWAFFGGRDVQGTYADVGGVKNYISHFDEMIRWQNVYGYRDNVTLSRFVTNFGKTGDDLAAVVAKLDDSIAKVTPQSIAYMVGYEDYSKGADEAKLNTFKTNLNTFITKGLAMRENTGRVMIQNPYVPADEALRDNARAYALAVNEVVNALSDDVKARVFVVNHNAKTAPEDFANKLNEDGYLNAYGHLALVKQIASSLNLSYNITEANISRELVSAPAEYSKDEITAVAGSDNALTIKSDAFTAGSSYTYKVETASYTVEDTAEYTADGIKTVALPANAEYTLTVTTADGATQYPVMAGTVANGTTAAKKTVTLDAKQQKVADLLKSKDSVMWMFMGDSITHGCLHTYGYDSISWMFEKYIKEDLGRTDDVVINTAISSATAPSTITDIDARLKAYKPDVVLLQLGMNDSGDTTMTTNFTQNMNTIINTIREVNEDAIIVLRTSTPVANVADGRDGRLSTVVEETRQLAANDDSIILADQYAAFKNLSANANYLEGNNSNVYSPYLIYNNNLHPHANGHIMMARTTIESLGFDTLNSEVFNHWYKTPNTDAASTVVPAVATAPGKIAISKAALESQYTDGAIGFITLKAVDKATGAQYSTKIASSENIASLESLPNGTYTVSVTVDRKDTSTTVSFAEQEVTLSDNMEVSFAVVLDNTTTSGEANSVIGTLSVDETAPSGTPVFTLSGENNDNDKFVIEGTQLKVGDTDVAFGNYTVCVKAQIGDYSTEKTFTVSVKSDLIYETPEAVTISGTNGSAITDEEVKQDVFDMTEGTFVFHFTSNSTYGIQSLFSVSNSTQGNSNRHFHIYVTPGGAIGMECRDNTTSNASNSFATGSGIISIANETKVVVKYDKTAQEYKVFTGGALVGTFSGRTAFINNITGRDNATLGATIRNGEGQYSFGGTIHNAQIYSTPLSDEECAELSLLEGQEPPFVIFESGSDVNAANLFNGASGNSWVFTGGVDMDGTYSNLGGAKNFMELFQNYGRGAYNMGSGDGGANSLTGNPNRERFMTNTGKSGADLSYVVENFDRLVNDLDPKVVAYLVGSEDYTKGDAGIEQFKTKLNEFITKGLALREGTGYVVIENPYAPADEELYAKARAYATAVNEVVSALDSSVLSRVKIVNFFAATDNDTFKSKSFNENGTLNPKGHLALSKQLSIRIIGQSGSETEAWLSKELVEGPTVYNKTATVAAVMNGSDLNVTVSGIDTENWKYTLELEDSYTVSCDSTKTAVFRNLPAGKKYTLTVVSADGTTQLTVMSGVTTSGNQAVKAQKELTELQQQVAELVNGDEPLTWMFMGDSITHGVAMNNGAVYDNISAMFRKYVREDLGREDDIVINTAVSSATTTSTLVRIEDRLNRYSPDIVSVQLGTNDATISTWANVPMDVETYKNNMRQLAQAIKAKGAIGVFRAPFVRPGNLDTTMLDFIEAAKEVAEEVGFIFVDQHTYTKEMVDNAPYLMSNTKYEFFGDSLHPAADGHIIMARCFIDGLGLDSYNSAVYNHYYVVPETADIASTSVPNATANDDSITVTGADVKKAYSAELSYFTVKAVKDGYTYTVKSHTTSDAVIADLPEGDYTVTVSANVKSEPKTVIFASNTVHVGEVVEQIPENLQTGDVTADSAVLTWEAPASTQGISKYVIKVDGETVAELNPNFLTYTLRNLDADKEYNVKIYAKNTDGQISETFAEVTFKTEPAAPAFMLGDVDHNGAVEAADATLVLQFYAGIITADTEGYDNSVADVDNSESVDATDATLILQKYADIITKFPAEAA